MMPSSDMRYLLVFMTIHPQVSPSISHDTHGMEEYVGRMRRITLLVENIKLSRQRIRIATEISVL